MKTIYAGLLGIGLFVGGYFYGSNNSNEIKVAGEQFSIENVDSSLILNLKNSGKTYELNSIDGELYLGSAQHNMYGAAKLSELNAQKKIAPYINRLSAKVDSLEAKLEQCSN